MNGSLPLRVLLLAISVVAAFTLASAAAVSSSSQSSDRSSSSLLSSFLPGLSSALRELKPYSDDDSLLQVVRQNVRFVLQSAMSSSPLELLDWTQLRTRTGQSTAERDLHRSDDAVPLAAGVRQPVALQLPHRSVAPVQRWEDAEEAAQQPSPPSPSSSLSWAPGVPCLHGGEAVLRNATSETRLCLCPYDWYGTGCGLRRPFACPLRLIAPPNTCNQARDYRDPTSAGAATLAPYSLSPSSSAFFVHEPALSGSSPPCLSLPAASLLLFNLSCRFTRPASEGWEDAAAFDLLRRQGFNVSSLPTLRYAVLTLNDSGGVQFALSDAPAALLRLDLTLVNTAHPSQSQSAQLEVNATHLQWPAAPLRLTLDPAALHRDLKRGGRLLLDVGFGVSPSVLNLAASRLPWRLYVEDGTFSLPAAPASAWLSSAQWLTLGLVLLVVALLLAWRCWQQRQTAKIQQIAAEQRSRGSELRRWWQQPTD